MSLEAPPFPRHVARRWFERQVLLHELQRAVDERAWLERYVAALRWRLESGGETLAAGCVKSPRAGGHRPGADTEEEPLDGAPS